MTSALSRWIDLAFRDTSVVAHAIADVGPVSEAERRLYADWIAAGRHASMAYMERNSDVRFSPALLLEGARSIICCAVAYPNPLSLPDRNSKIAAYALGSDYHEVVRRELTVVAERIRRELGGETRVCVDTAPLRERYWACRSGLGTLGLNGHLFVPGAGSCVFLGEILTTAHLPADKPLPTAECTRCGRCVKACPAGAIGPDGNVDARRCLSYLTIEHRGDLPADADLHGNLYGCDICTSVCPLNAPDRTSAVEIHPDLRPRRALLDLTVSQAASMTQQEFSTLFTHSAIKRAKLTGLHRNALRLLHQS